MGPCPFAPGARWAVGGTFSSKHMTNAKARGNRPEDARSRRVGDAARPVRPDGQAGAENAPGAECGALAALDARLAKHVAAFERGDAPRVWHLAAAKGLYALIGDAVRDGADPCELSMVGAPHWLVYTPEQMKAMGESYPE